METLLDKKAVFKVIKYRKKLEKALKIKIKIGKEKVDFIGKSDDEFIAKDIFEAINAGFSIGKVLLLLEETFMLEKIHIRDITKRKSLREVRARVIGKKGSTLELLSNLSDCFIELKENEIYIIGDAEDVEICMTALKNLVKGSKQSNVYKYLERVRIKRKQQNLGLR